MQAIPAACAAAGDANATGSVVEQQAAGVGLDDAGHDLDQRRLAGAVLAQHGVDAAGLDREIGALERAHAAVALGHALHHEQAHRATSLRASRRGPEAQRPARTQRLHRYLFASVWPMISCAVKLMPQVGNELPTKKLSESLA